MKVSYVVGTVAQVCPDLIGQCPDSGKLGRHVVDLYIHQLTNI
jgi:hypothetical protein